MDDNKKNIKLIVFKDDNDKAKDKDSIIYEKDEWLRKIRGRKLERILDE